MKRLFIFILSSLMILAGCQNISDTPKDMYITPAQLTDGEKQISKMASSRSYSNFFDYKVNDTIKALRVDIYRLAEDGSWQYEEGGYSNMITEESREARLMIQRNQTDYSLTMATGTANGHTSWNNNQSKDYSNGGYSHSVLEEPQSIVLGGEIPLIIEIFSPEGKISGAQVDKYYETESILDNIALGNTVLATVVVFDDNVE